METLPFPVGIQLQLSRQLPHDPEVLDELERLREEAGDLAGLPTKGETARLVLNAATAAKDGGDAEGFEKLMKLYCSIVGYIEKPGTNVAVNNNSTTNVLVVTNNGSDDEWEKKAGQQQSRLTLDARSVN